MIKTISGGECKFLRTILPSYLEHIKANPHTLLTRFYGMHRVKVSERETGTKDGEGRCCLLSLCVWVTIWLRSG